MLYLSDKDVDQILSGRMDDVVELMREMFVLVDRDEYTMGGLKGKSHGMRLHIKGDTDQLYLAMPGYIGGRFHAAGLKWHGPNKYLEGNESDIYYTLILTDLLSGKTKSVMCADMLTRYRTAAVAALAVDVLHKKEPAEVALIGTGRINGMILSYLLQKYPSIRKVSIKGHNPEHRDIFIKKFKMENPKCEISAVETVKDAVINADIAIINSGLEYNNLSEMPMIKSRWIKDDCIYICCSYANFPDKDLIGRAIKICDLYETYEEYEEELGYPAYRQYGSIGARFADLVVEKKITRESILDLSDIIVGKRSIDADNGPVIFSSTGMSTQDIVLASMVYEEAKVKNMGVEVE